MKPLINLPYSVLGSMVESEQYYDGFILIITSDSLVHSNVIFGVFFYAKQKNYSLLQELHISNDTLVIGASK